MTEFHVPHCDCDACLPGFEATATPVHHDPRPLLIEGETEASAMRRRKRQRARRREWRQQNIEQARQEVRDWRAANPEKVLNYKRKKMRDDQLARFVERFKEGSTAAE